MYLEILAFFGLIILVLVALAETKKPAMGLFAAIFLFVLSLWIMSEPLQMRSGETKSISSTSVLVDNTTSTNSTETINYQYSNVPDYPYTTLQSILSLPLLLISIYGIWYYVGEITLRGL